MKGETWRKRSLLLNLRQKKLRRRFLRGSERTQKESETAEPPTKRRRKKRRPRRKVATSPRVHQDRRTRTERADATTPGAEIGMDTRRQTARRRKMRLGRGGEGPVAEVVRRKVTGTAGAVRGMTRGLAPEAKTARRGMTKKRRKRRRHQELKGEKGAGAKTTARTLRWMAKTNPRRRQTKK